MPGTMSMCQVKFLQLYVEEKKNTATVLNFLHFKIILFQAISTKFRSFSTSPPNKIIWPGIQHRLHNMHDNV